MSQLKELIKDLCPDGVVYKTIQETVGVNRGKRLVKNQLSNDGKYEVYHGSKDSILGKYNQYNAPANTTIVVNTGGIGGVKFLDKPFWCSDGSFWLGQSNEIHSKYLYYCLSGYEDYFYSQKRIGGVPTIDRNVVETFKIPIPPLEVQNEIVRILDTFTSHTAELQAELQARKKQYEYYRNKLLSFDKNDENVKWMKLGEFCDILTGFPFDSSNFVTQGIRLMRGMNIKRGLLDFNKDDNRYWKDSIGFERYLLAEDDIVISMDGSLVGKSFGIITKKHLPLLLVQRVARIRTTKYNIRYVYFYITNKFSEYVDKVKTKGAIPHISKKNISDFVVPIPPLSEQQRIVSILDKFETLVNDLIEGIPAEIAAVQEQYEYYRNKLLSFPKLEE